MITVPASASRRTMADLSGVRRSSGCVGSSGSIEESSSVDRDFAGRISTLPGGGIGAEFGDISSTIASPDGTPIGGGGISPSCAKTGKAVNAHKRPIAKI